MASAVGLAIAALTLILAVIKVREEVGGVQGGVREEVGCEGREG